MKTISEIRKHIEGRKQDDHTLYLAYGSNLNIAQMATRCPAAQPLGRFTLPGWQLMFRPVADIVRGRKNQKVECGLWLVTPECVEALDYYEGHRPDGRGAYRREYLATIPGMDDALTYVMNRSNERPPTPRYASTILEGYRDFGIALNGSKAHAALIRSAAIGQKENVVAWDAEHGREADSWMRGGRCG